MGTFKNAVKYLPLKDFKLSTGNIGILRINLRYTKIH